MPQYVWQHPTWPHFSIDYEQLTPQLGRCRHLQGQLFQQVKSLGLDLELKAQLEALTKETVKTAEIEGELLNPDSVRSSVATRLGLPTAGLPAAPRSVDGLVDVLLDATSGDDRPLTAERLKSWQAALFPTGFSGLFEIVTGDWRSEPVQVVSGRIGREKIHYEAPPAARVEAEMSAFLEWWRETHPARGGIDPILRAAIAHYWFVAIHPFDDGNGRIGRALADMALAQADGAAKRCYSLSSTIMESRDSYYKVLSHTSGGKGDLTKWICWFLSCYEHALRESQTTISKVMGISRFWRNVSHLDMNTRQRKALGKLLEAGEDGFEGGLTARKYQGMSKGSRATVTRDLADLVEKGVLFMEGERRAAKYNLNWDYTKEILQREGLASEEDREDDLSFRP
jgi:Fic family protein